MGTYRSVEAWHAAVRHAGALFQLPSPETDDDNPLPYPALEHASARPSTKLVSGLHLVQDSPPPGVFAPAVVKYLFLLQCIASLPPSSKSSNLYM